MRILNTAIIPLLLICVVMLPACSGITAIYPTVTITETVYTSELVRFESYQELRTWLDSVYFEMRGARQPDWICQDYSWWLVERASQDGYLMIYHGIRAEQYNNSFTNLQLDGGHAITATYINGLTYLIEPQNFEVFPNGD